ncbi:hydroxymyristoyl-ACP dehydratase [Salegentibacter chungangensis]|uniref:Hydroxymyristoyl-ACP dehydratase n=1 Tax=Salegentibacter chungangensis TaxID=1335724 RepID=A0ABW3NS26_9FLAO
MLLKDFYSVQDSKKEGDTYITRIKIDKHHKVYKGHFPGRPVTPGVILMHLFREELERHTASVLKLERATNVKFMAVVDPNQDEYLTLESEIEEFDGFVKLKGTAKQKDKTSLKINALYRKAE